MSAGSNPTRDIFQRDLLPYDAFKRDLDSKDTQIKDLNQKLESAERERDANQVKSTQQAMFAQMQRTMQALQQTAADEGTEGEMNEEMVEGQNDLQTIQDLQRRAADMENVANRSMKRVRPSETESSAKRLKLTGAGAGDQGPGRQAAPDSTGGAPFGSGNVFTGPFNF